MQERRPRSVLMITGRTVGGAAEHLLLLARLIDPERTAVEIALLGTGPLDEALRATGLPVHQLGGTADAQAAVAWRGGPVQAARATVQLWRLLRSRQFEIVHTHTTVAGVLGRVAAVLARTPVRVHMAHSVPGAHPGPRARRVAARVAERLLASVTSEYIAGSEAAAAQLRTTLGRSRTPVRTIHYSVDAERFLACSGSAAARHKRWHPTGREVVVGIVGRLEPQKGVSELLPALGPLFTRCPEARLVLVGDGSVRASLEQRVIALGLADHVEFTGWVERGGEVIPALDVLALPSRWEPFGIVNLEAALAGIPVVAFAVDGVPEVVVDGETGVLVRPGDVAGFVENLTELVSDGQRRSALGANARLRVPQFLPSTMVAAHHDLYESSWARRRLRRRWH